MEDNEPPNFPDDLYIFRWTYYNDGTSDPPPLPKPEQSQEPKEPPKYDYNKLIAESDGLYLQWWLLWRDIHPEWGIQKVEPVAIPPAKVKPQPKQLSCKRCVQVWRDESNIDPGSPDWEEAIREAISHAYAFVLIASPDVIQSRYIKGELILAKRYHPNRIYPVWMDGTNWSDCVPIDFINTQYVDMRGEKYEGGFRALVAVLQKAKEQPSPPQQDSKVYQQGAVPPYPPFAQQGVPSSPSPQPALNSPPRQQPYPGSVQNPQNSYPTPLQGSQQVAPPSVSLPKKPRTMSVQVQVALISTVGVILVAIITAILGPVIIKGFTPMPTPIPSLATTQTTATVTANNATTTPQAALSPYLPDGKLSLDDPLTMPSQFFNNFTMSGIGSCQFIGQKFVLTSVETNVAYHCTATPSFINFAFEITMQIQKGDCGGMLIRGDSSDLNGYLFAVCRTGSYSLSLLQNGHPTTLLAGGASIPGFNTGLNQTNIIAIAANGNTFVLYVNRQKTDEAKDGTFTHGFLGPVAENLSGPTIVVYSNAKVWTVS